MPDPASLTPSSSTFSGITTGTITSNPSAASQPTDGGENGGFQAALAQQNAPEIAPEPAPPPALLPALTLPAITLAASITLAATGAATGNANPILPPTGKILPPNALTSSTDDADQPTADATQAVDPALMLMLNASALPPAALPTPSQASTNQPSSKATSIGKGTIQTAQTPPNTTQSTAQSTAPVAQPVAALAITADPAPGQSVSGPAISSLAISLAPTKSAEETQPAAVELRPVLASSAKAQGDANQSSANGQSANQGSEQGLNQGRNSTLSQDPLASTATDDAKLALPPTHGLAEASASTAPSVPTQDLASGAATPLQATAPASASNMAALVDRLVEARQAARMAGPQSVTASIPHAEFGRVSLNFRQDEAGLSVGMTSPDASFAPAAQAALALQASQISAAGTNNDTRSDPNPSGSQQNERREAFLSQNGGQASGQTSSQSGNQQSARNNAPARWSEGSAPRAEPTAPSTAATLSSRSGILA